VQAPDAVPHVLVVDDDAMIRTLIVALLETLHARGTVCADAASARDALKRAKEEGPPVNLVVLDLRLGGKSGLDLCTELRAEGVDVSIVCLSGDPGAVAREVYDRAGFDDVLAKPLGLQELEACISRHAWRKHGG
jgi:DNA-binding response OmpR family regulator